MKLIYRLIFFLASLHSNAQFQVSGKVVDFADREVPFASIQVKNTKMGTYANENGEFMLMITQIPCELQITSVGYQSLIYRLDDLKLPLHLTLLKNDNILPNVFVLPDSTLKTILKKAYSRIVDNYPTREFDLEGFYHELNQEVASSKLIYYGDAYLKVHCSSYDKKSEDGQVEIIKARNIGTPKADTIDNVKYYGGAFIASFNDFVKTRKSFLNPENFNRQFSYSLEDIICHNQDSVYVIKFRSVPDKNENSGELWITKESYAYIRILVENNHPQSVHPISKRLSQKSETYYQKTKNKWYLSYTTYSGENYNKATHKRIKHETVFLTTSLHEDTSPIPFDKRLDFRDVFALQQSTMDPHLFDSYSTLLTDSLHQIQLKAFRTEAEKWSNEVDNTKKNNQVTRLITILQRLGFQYSLDYILSNPTPPAMILYNNAPIQAGRSIKNIPVLTTKITFTYNKHISLFHSHSQEITNSTFYKSNLWGVGYTCLIKKSGHPILWVPSLSAGNIKAGYRAGTLRSSDNLVFENKKMAKKVDVITGNSAFSCNSSMQLMYKRRRLIYVIAGEYSLFFNQEPKIFIRKNRTLGDKVVGLSPATKEFAGSQIVSSALFIKPLKISFGLQIDF